MDREKQDKILNSFPLLYGDRDKPMTQTGMCWGFECGDGWFDLLWELSEKLEAEIKKHLELGEPEFYPRAAQVKEKFGGLRFYMDCETEEMSRLIEEAEAKSEKTCEVCGAEGEIRPDGGKRFGWLTCLCPKHREEREAYLAGFRDRKMAEGRGA